MVNVVKLQNKFIITDLCMKYFQHKHPHTSTVREVRRGRALCCGQFWSCSHIKKSFKEKKLS